MDRNTILVSFMMTCLIGLITSISVYAQEIEITRLPTSEVNQPAYDLYDIRRPGLSLSGFDNTEQGYNPDYGLGLKQVLELRYNQLDDQIVPVFDQLITVARRTLLNPYELPAGAERRLRLEKNANVIQSRTFEALVTFVLELNGYNPESFGLLNHAEAMIVMKQGYVSPPGGVFIAGDDLIEDYVKYPRSIGHIARGIDLYLALENAYIQFPDEVDYSLLMSQDERGSVMGEFGLALLTEDFVLTTLAIDVYADDIDLPPEEKEALLEILRQLPAGDNTVEEVESGNWALKQRLAIGYGSLAMQVVPGSVEESLFLQLLPSALQSGDLTTIELDDRLRHWNFMSFGGKRFWAESAYYLDYSLEQVLPFWHALRVNGLLDQGQDPFFNDAMLDPINWLVDTVTPDGRILPFDDGNRARIRHCGLIRWDSNYGESEIAEKCAWIDEKLGGPGHRDEILLMEIAVPRTTSTRIPVDMIGNDPGPLVTHVSEQQLIRRFSAPDQSTHFIALNGEHGKAVDRGEGHEQPDQLQLLYYVDEISYLLDSGYDRAGTVENSTWNHYYDHNTMTVGGGEGGLQPPELRILEVRKASEPELMGEVSALHIQQHGNITILHGNQVLSTGPALGLHPIYNRDVLLIEGDAPYLIDLNRIGYNTDQPECAWNQFSMNYHVNADQVIQNRRGRRSQKGFVRWDKVQSTPGLSFFAFPLSLEFDLGSENLQLVPDEVLESELGPVKTTVDIKRLAISNTSYCDAEWSLATLLMADKTGNQPKKPILIWKYKPEMARQGWIWKRDEHTYDVFVIRTDDDNSEDIVFNFRRANRKFPNVKLKLAGEQNYGFARVIKTEDGWAINPDYDIAFKLVGHTGRHRRSGVSSREAYSDEQSGIFSLDGAYPNPFNPETVIRYSLPEESIIRLSVYDLLGREVRRLVDGYQVAGNHEIVFDGTGLSTGIYLYTLETPVGTFTRRFTLIK